MKSRLSWISAGLVYGKATHILWPPNRCQTLPHTLTIIVFKNNSNAERTDYYINRDYNVKYVSSILQSSHALELSILSSHMVMCQLSLPLGNDM